MHWLKFIKYLSFANAGTLSTGLDLKSPFERKIVNIFLPVCYNIILCFWRLKIVSSTDGSFEYRQHICFKDNVLLHTIY